jgi:hypothetical protein
MPPGFMKATTAPPLAAGFVASSWASAMTSPSADSPAVVGVRVMLAVIDPTTLLPSGADSVPYFETIAVSVASLGTSRVTTSFTARFDVIEPVALSTVSVMRVSIRPNELALVTSLPPIVQL